MSAIVQTMMKEDPEVNLTPMIDVVFLLLIFFMLQRFRVLENKLPSELPIEHGLFMPSAREIKQLRFSLLLVPGSINQVQIKADPEIHPFYFVNFIPGKEGKKQMFRKVTNMIVAGWDDFGMDKIEISPQQKVPFDYVAQLLNSIHQAKEMKEKDLLEKIKLAMKKGNSRLVESLEKKLVKVTFKASKLRAYE
ncbi:MAG: biopolymer transporter ExbD [Planctomycetes bacterium]|nr:biopolymer transporter ExbD [Planctomycetota bacterium]